MIQMKYNKNNIKVPTQNIDKNNIKPKPIIKNSPKKVSFKDISKIIFYMKQDKKNKDSKINLILLKSIEKPILNKSFRENNIRSFLKTLIYW